MADRREPDWPISRFVVRTSLSRSGIPPLRESSDVVAIEGSFKQQWARFEVAFSRLVIERLPMETDDNNQYLGDEPRLARQIVRSFIEMVTDLTIQRRGKWHYVARFTLYTKTIEGTDSYNRRVAAIKQGMSWDDWRQGNE